MADFTRRLPVYLLLDCSGSMAGEPMEAVRQGIKALLSELRGDPQALETAWLSVITFDSRARQTVPLTELMLFREPELSAGGATALGGALRVLIECVKTEVRRASPTQKGDWRPLVFLLTDGSPTDVEEFRLAAAELREIRAANIVACAAGSRADTTYLKQLTDNVIMMNTLSAGDLAEFFQWVSGSVKMGSRGVDGAANPPPPQGFVVVP